MHGVRGAGMYSEDLRISTLPLGAHSTVFQADTLQYFKLKVLAVMVCAEMILQHISWIVRILSVIGYRELIVSRQSQAIYW